MQVASIHPLLGGKNFSYVMSYGKNMIVNVFEILKM